MEAQARVFPRQAAEIEQFPGRAFLIVDKRLSASAAIPLFGLFVFQFFVPDETIRIILSGVYFLIAGGLLLRRFPLVIQVIRDGFFGGPLSAEIEEFPPAPAVAATEEVRAGGER